MAHLVRSMLRSGLAMLGLCGMMSVGLHQASVAKNSDNLKYQYSEKVVESYVAACGREATEMLPQPVMHDICVCTIEEFQQQYSLSEFRAIGQAIAAGDEAPSEMTSITSDCVQQVMFRPDV